MTEPKSTIHIRHIGGYMVREGREEILAMEGELLPRDFLTLHAITFEGHEFPVSIRVSEISSVIDLPSERFQFELESFMGQRADAEADVEMRRSFAQFGEAATQEMRGDV